MARILVVDDEKEVLDSFRRALQNSGYDVVIAKSPEVAIQRMTSAETGEFDLAVIDIFLGGQTSGFQVARRMSECHPAAGILMVSGLLVDRAPRHRLPTGRVAFLKKPLELDRLVRTAERLRP